jgi:hypothetical protein
LLKSSCVPPIHQVLCTPLGPFRPTWQTRGSGTFASEESTISPLLIYLDLLPGHFGAADRLPVSILEEDWSRPFPMSKQLQSRFMATRTPHLVSALLILSS